MSLPSVAPGSVRDFARRAFERSHRMLDRARPVGDRAARDVAQRFVKLVRGRLVAGFVQQLRGFAGRDRERLAAAKHDSVRLFNSQPIPFSRKNLFNSSWKSC